MTQTFRQTMRWHLFGRLRDVLLPVVVLSLIGVVIWWPQVSAYRGYLYNDCGHLVYSYANQLRFHLADYLPWAKVAHRPLGRDSITLLLRIFGEDHEKILGSLLALHIINSFLLWKVVKVVDRRWWIATSSAVFFLVSINAFLPVYWPGAIFDLLCVTFLLISVIALLFSENVSSKWIKALLLLSNVLFFIFAAKAKESALMAAIPIAFLFISMVRRKHDDLSLKKLVGRLSLLECIWGLSFIAICLSLALNVVSDFNPGTGNVVDPAYARIYSFNVIFTSFGLYIANYFYVTNTPAPLSPAMACVIVCATFMVAVFLRNFLMIFGVIWWLSLLIVLASMINLYQSPHYPYPATVGGACFLAGTLGELSRILNSHKIRKIVMPLFCSCLMYVLCFFSYQWVRHDLLPRWAVGFHKLSMQMLDSLKQIVPAPETGAEFVFVTDKFSFLDQGPSTVMKAIYKNTSLTARICKTLEEGRNTIAKSSSQKHYLLMWQENHFELQSVS